MDMAVSEGTHRESELGMDERSRSSLIRETGDSYGQAFKVHLLEQYKLYVQSAENVSTRRVSSGRYLLTISAALVALYGIQTASFGQNYWTLVIPVMGFLVSILWYRIIQSHADLNVVKFKLIHEMEKHLPAAIYAHEWQLVKEGKGKVYKPVTTIERWLPILFAALHAVLGIMIVLAITDVLDLIQ